MKIQVGIVHLVTKALKLCYKAVLGLLVMLSESAAFGII